MHILLQVHSMSSIIPPLTYTHTAYNTHI